MMQSEEKIRPKKLDKKQRQSTQKMENNTIRTTTETQEVGMTDKVSGEDSGGRAWWRRFRTT